MILQKGEWRKKMEEAINFYKSESGCANLNIIGLYKHFPIKSYSLSRFRRDGYGGYLVDIDMLSPSGEVKYTNTFGTQIAKFVSFLLDHAKTQEEYLTFLEAFFVSLGDQITIEGLNIKRESPPHKWMLLKTFIRQVNDPVRLSEELEISIENRQSFLAESLIEHGVPYGPDTIKMCREYGLNALADKLEIPDTKGAIPE